MSITMYKDKCGCMTLVHCMMSHCPATDED